MYDETLPNPFESVQPTVDWVAEKFSRSVQAAACAHKAASDFNNEMIALEIQRAEAAKADRNIEAGDLQKEIDRAEERTQYWTDVLHTEERTQRELVGLFVAIHKQGTAPVENILPLFDGFDEGEAH